MKDWKREAEIRPISIENQQDANIPNQPFALWGRLIPSLTEGYWSYRILEFAEKTEMCFPDYPYDVEDGGYYYGAYVEEQCIGVAVLREGMFRYLYLEDLKVDVRYRGFGIGKMLVEACMNKARELQMQGVYTIGQDNNLSACLFYIRNGFAIGGFDNRAYRGTVQEEKADIYFYKDVQ